MKTIVITGSTRGIGYSLARSFLEKGHRVVINGRSRESVNEAVEKLSEIYPREQVLGQPADVSKFADMQALWQAARENWGQVDIWINNAGIGSARENFWDLPPDWLDDVVSTNLTGMMYGCRVALRGMIEQGGGEIYNMEGFGSDGRFMKGLLVYGTTKRATRYLTDGLAQEAADTPVIVGALSPGMVVTDLLIEPYRRNPQGWERARRVFNILADRVEVVTPWLAEQILKNEENGAEIRWLTRWKITTRFLLAPFSRRDLFEGEGVPEKGEI